MSFRSAARHIASHQAMRSQQYFNEQQRSAALAAASSSTGYLESFRTIQERQTVTAPNGEQVTVTHNLTPADPIQAIRRDSLFDRQPDLVPVIRADHDPCTPALAPAPEQTRPAVSVTAADYRALDATSQATVRAQALAYPGAAQRIRDHGTTLAAAFYAELDYQASIQRGLARNLSDGKTTRYSKTQSKIDRRSGQRGLKSAGTASFRRGVVIRVTTIIDEHFPREVPGMVDVRKLRRGEPGMLALNAPKPNQEK